MPTNDQGPMPNVLRFGYCSFVIGHSVVIGYRLSVIGHSEREIDAHLRLSLRRLLSPVRGVPVIQRRAAQDLSEVRGGPAAAAVRDRGGGLVQGLRLL